MSPKSAHASQEAREQESGVLRVVEESLSAQVVIRAFAVEHLGAAAFRTRNDALTRSAMKAGLWSAVAERFTASGIVLEQVFVLGLSLWLVAGQLAVGESRVGDDDRAAALEQPGGRAVRDHLGGARRAD